jgi:hypothetical protein
MTEITPIFTYFDEEETIYYRNPDRENLEDFVNEVRTHPTKIKGLFAAAVEHTSFSITTIFELFEPFGYNVNDQCFYIEDEANGTIMDYLLLNMRADDLQYILSKNPDTMGTHNIWDMLFDMVGPSWTNTTPLSKIQPQVIKIIDCIKVIYSAGYKTKVETHIPNKYTLRKFLRYVRDCYENNILSSINNQEIIKILALLYPGIHEFFNDMLKKG